MTQIAMLDRVPQRQAHGLDKCRVQVPMAAWHDTEKVQLIVSQEKKKNEQLRCTVRRNRKVPSLSGM
jgi:hypothetical protein